MPSLQFSDGQIQEKAVQLGVVSPGMPVPPRLRSRVVAALAAETARPAKGTPVPVAREIVVQPGGSIDIDGRPFPWVVQADQIEVTLGPDGAGLVRLTIPAHNIQITKPADEEPR